MMTRDAFEGYDEPVKIVVDPEEAVKLLLAGDESDEETEKSQV